MRTLPEMSEEICDSSGRKISVGDRVSVTGAMATVKFVGNLHDDPESWIGVHWDEPGRGRHDGCAHGIRYFTTPEPNSASFVRPHKLDPSQTCAEAIRKYYSEGEDETTAAINKSGIDEWKKIIKVPFIEMIGFDNVQQKQSTLDKLLEACVSDRHIWTSGDLATLCPLLHILDLSKNLLNNWRVIAEIASQLPQLTSLDISKNKILISLSNDEFNFLSQYFESLKLLSMNYCDFEWEDIKKISLMCSNLEEIIAAYNKIESITVSCYKMNLNNLKTLILDGNPLLGWDEILKLGNLNNLKTLSVNDCGFKNIVFDDRFYDEKTSHFEELDTLFIKNNEINNWRSISELNKLKTLKKLYLTKNPLMSTDDYDTSCQFIIARIGCLMELNGSEISREARRGAEYDYIKKYGLQWKQIQNIDEIKNFCLLHSRFKFLIEKYGMPDDNLLTNKKKSWAINTNLLELTLKDESSGLCIKKKLPSTMSVQKLIALTRRLFGSKSNNANSSVHPQLFVIHTSNNENEMLFHLDNQMKELHFYSVINGDTILIRW